jgi:peptide/nickel transport system substrate-binding protein
MRRNRLRRLAAACLGAALLAGCGGREPPTDGKVLRVAAGSLPSSLGNPFRGNSRPGSLLWLAIYDGLTAIDEEGRLGPGLATHWEPAAPTVWRLKLRDGVRYSNGRPFDAEAAAGVFAFLRSDQGRRTLGRGRHGDGRLRPEAGRHRRLRHDRLGPAHPAPDA